MSAKAKISTARYLAMSMAPYFSSVLYKLTFKQVPLGTLSQTGTLGVSDKAVCMYEAEAIARWTDRQLAAVIIHEINHLVRHHSRRCGTRDHKMWNLAGDAEINDDLQAMRLPLPDVPFVPENVPAPRGLTAEEYYVLMQDGDGKGKGGKKPPEPNVGAGQCGGCSGGDPNNSDAEDEADEEHGRSDVEMEAARDQVAQAVKQESQRGRGTVPAGLVRWADAQLAPPKIPWQTKLARACRRLVSTRPGAVDYKFSRLSRRQAGVGYGPGKPILPGLIEPIPNVAVGLDTSGSMGEKEIMAGARETAGIMRAVGVGVTFLACDAAVHAVKKVATPKELAACIKGGGGTDFRPIFKAVEEINPRPEVFVFITDGQGPAPDHPPKGTQVIWLLTGPYKTRPVACSADDGGYGDAGPVDYGVFIEMDD